MNQTETNNTEITEDENYEPYTGKPFPELHSFQPEKSYKTNLGFITCLFLSLIFGAIFFFTGYKIVGIILFTIAGIMPILIFANFIFTAFQFFNKTVEQNNQIIEMLDDYFYEEDEE